MRPLVAKLRNRLQLFQYWLIAQLAFGLMAVLRLVPADSALTFTDKAARTLGPLSGRHRVALDNLRQAYPDKSAEEHEAIARAMWGNMGRLAAEYIFLDRLFDYDPERPGSGRVDVVGADIFRRLHEEKKARLFFTGHLGNFEFLPIAASTFGLEMTSMFRPPNNPYIADYVFRRRSGAMGALLASRRGVAFTVARILENEGNVGVLVDQHFSHGVPTTFFGRACESSPLVAKLTRNYNCDVHPARCVRLPNNRYRLEIQEAITIPRGPDGRVDVPATTQLLNDIAEGWVREDPGQWMWFHKRWK
ncbi:MAG TPA: lipid A biosynthesis lauroyl acyltransferase, partial [Tianweitania sediminis]|nr:lipid A biosynthesis lauroyl acyltransferase [Tianweitania sediminis]